MNKINEKELCKKIHNKIQNWSDWKKKEYNDNFAISPYAKKIIIKK